MDDLGKLIVSRIQAVNGITRTLTCPGSTPVGSKDKGRFRLGVPDTGANPWQRTSYRLGLGSAAGGPVIAGCAPNWGGASAVCMDSQGHRPTAREG